METSVVVDDVELPEDDDNNVGSKSDIDESPSSCFVVPMTKLCCIIGKSDQAKEELSKEGLSIVKLFSIPQDDNVFEVPNNGSSLQYELWYCIFFKIWNAKEERMFSSPNGLQVVHFRKTVHSKRVPVLLVVLSRRIEFFIVVELVIVALFVRA